ncbi:hypothetical protein A2755_03415 [Candidatus Wolfebacteria bacterium RIFCSPHIGHO2_01_FULL_48_22]|uniref:Uncharacterized protein n=2 Tax=Candidatus Wolfeibacteriota TaxID=1752735 RepID=A0A1F8DQ85_9BACT|nr:MAG: hypothetical protein A2755_03415 [Candidatus Wolfebacteria bacterium RIFCSPHIGHO2_01_FULL_48_22]OGM92076.1 MAG: hypothetical protein A2935_01905 [Candidatus Wolfebacteria bacterium RIFCSPLOWO2_01_FULL_47_17b]
MKKAPLLPTLIAAGILLSTSFAYADMIVGMSPTIIEAFGNVFVLFAVVVISEAITLIIASKFIYKKWLAVKHILFIIILGNFVTSILGFFATSIIARPDKQSIYILFPIFFIFTVFFELAFFTKKIKEKYNFTQNQALVLMTIINVVSYVIIIASIWESIPGVYCKSTASTARAKADIQKIEALQVLYFTKFGVYANNLMELEKKLDTFPVPKPAEYTGSQRYVYTTNKNESCITAKEKNDPCAISPNPYCIYR